MTFAVDRALNNNYLSIYPHTMCTLTAPDAHCANESYKGTGNILAHTDTDTRTPFIVCAISIYMWGREEEGQQ